MNLIPLIFSSVPGLAWQVCLKKAEVELELATDIDILMMVEKGIRVGICHTIHRYAKANNKYMNNYEKTLYLMYLDVNNLYGWGMSEKLSVNCFKSIKKLSKFNEDFIKNYSENSNKEYIFELDVEYLKNVFNLHRDLSFLAERNKIEKCNDKENYVVNITALKEALNHGLILK